MNDGIDNFLRKKNAILGISIKNFSQIPKKRTLCQMWQNISFFWPGFSLSGKNRVRKQPDSLIPYVVVDNKNG